jgi:phosphate transport system protein
MTLQAELDQLESEIQAQAGRVLHILGLVLEALDRQDVDRADETMAFDDEIDEGYLAIEREIELLLARKTPVAVDLRLSLAVLHINLHLERMADYCVSIAKIVKASERLAPAPALVESLGAMGTRALEMTRVALDSFGFRDLAGAESLVNLDQRIERASERVFDDILELRSDPEMREWSQHMLLVSRCLERIGDHAVDIGEQTAYLITAAFREFTDASHLTTSD